MKIKSLILLIMITAMLFPTIALGQNWSEDQIEQAKTELQEKYKLESSLSFNQEGVLETETFQVFPAAVEITDEGLFEGLTVALVKYGEDEIFQLFVASLPNLNPPHGAALINGEGEVVHISTAGIQGKQDGPETANIELIESEEEPDKVALNFPAATITVEIPKNSPVTETKAA